MRCFLHRRLLVLSTALLLHGTMAAAQQPPASPPSVTFWYDYTVKPGKEEEFLNLVKTVGSPVRDKLMADGVVTAWGVEVPLLRSPGGPTHTIWYSTNDWAGVAKVQAAMAEQLAKPAAGAPAKGARPVTNAERSLDVFDMTRTRDWLTRDIESGFATTMPAPGVLPVTRYSFTKVRPGKGAEYRKVWDKYNRPVYEKLAADGVILAWGLAVEDIKTDGDFTHFAWVATADMAAFDKVRAAFNADRDKRSEEERDGITASFTAVIDPDASRTLVTRSLIFKLPAPK